MKYFSSILAGLLLLILNIESAQAVGPTYLKDSITVSTNWTKDNSPYVLQNDITVAKGAVLTIDPGVEVRFVVPTTGKVGSGPNLVIAGGLKAVGSSAAPIMFGPAVTGSLWGAIYFYNSDAMNSVLQGCMVKGGRIVCNGSSPTITQCSIYGAKTGLEIALNSQPQIINNRITANGIGVLVLSDTASPVITNNEIYGNNYGVCLKDFGAANISSNKIYNNIHYNFVNYSAKPLVIPSNDFRMVDAQQIMKTIYDGAYNANLGRLNFMPFAGMATGQTAPVVAAAPAGTVTQEKPQIQEEEFWSYGRPFDAMKISNVDQQKKKPSSAVKILAVGATAVVTVVLLFL